MRAGAAQLEFRLGDEILVPELEVATSGVPTEPPRREDLRAPPRRELRHGSRLCPGLAREALRQLEERKRGVAPVADQVHPDRVREETLEQRELLHVERRLVAPARLSLPLGVRLEDRSDRVP